MLLGAVATAEFVYLASGVHDLLLAGVKRVASAADFDTEVTPGGGPGLELVAATAGDNNLLVLGMDIGLSLIHI